jgi:hypothetical protein
LCVWLGFVVFVCWGAQWLREFRGSFCFFLWGWVVGFTAAG